MPKQTVEFLRQVAIIGVSAGCIIQHNGTANQPVKNDLKCIRSLIEKARNIRATLMNKKALFIKMSKTPSIIGKIELINLIHFYLNFFSFRKKQNQDSDIGD